MIRGGSSSARMNFPRMAAHAALAATLWPAVAFGANSSEAASIDPPAPASDPGTRTAIDRSAVLGTADGLTLHLTTDIGSVRIVPIEPGTPAVVRYSVHIETDARGPLAQSLLDRYTLTAKETSKGVNIVAASPSQAGRSGGYAQFFVQFEVAVPPGYNLDVNTGVGDIETQDIGGTANLATQGGNIRTGRIGTMSQRGGWQGRMLAKLSTEGGHIQVQDVAGNLDAFTAGGDIVTGNILGSGVLRTGGGHIRAGKIGGRAQLETDGGNITLKQAESFVSVRTGGGQIDFGEVRGSVRAQTGGGGIRIITVSGPMEVESNGGSVCLTRVAGAVQAATAGGNIQAWINPDAVSSRGTVSLLGTSQLSSGAGDIVVFLPKNLAATIDVLVESGGAGRIAADPGLPLNFQLESNRATGEVHAVGTLNGGGAILKLRTTVGRIHLQSEETDQELRDALIREQSERINRRSGGDYVLPVKSTAPALADGGAPSLDGKSDWLEGWMDKLEIYLLGGLREDSGDFVKRLIARPDPVYPELARRARIQGVVILQVKVRADGSVGVEKVLQGEPVLAQAAKEAVERWRARPAIINGTRVETISTIKFDFELQH